MRAILLVVLAFLCLPASPARAQVTEISLDHDGRTRTARVFVPSRGAAGRPLVLIFHGGGGHAENVANQTGFDALAEREGFLAVYPNGSSFWGTRLLTWNAGACCGYAMKQGIDDVGFVDRLIDRLIADHAIDASRVYATGHSNGAQISYRLACELSDRIAAIAANGSQGVFHQCNAVRPVPILHIHGLDDRCALYAGGACGGCFHDFARDMGLPIGAADTWACDPVEEILTRRAEANGCRPSRFEAAVAGPVVCEGYDGCPAGAEVRLCRIAEHGHGWPGGQAGPQACERNPDGFVCTRWRRNAGTVYQGWRATEAAWAFFQRHRLP